MTFRVVRCICVTRIHPFLLKKIKRYWHWIYHLKNSKLPYHQKSPSNPRPFTNWRLITNYNVNSKHLRMFVLPEACKFRPSVSFEWQRSRNLGGGYKICSHWSNLRYPRKDSTRYPRRVDPIERTLRVSKRPFKQPHSNCATLWHPPVTGPAMFMHNGAMYTTHCEYQGPAAARSHGSFGLAKQKFWFECDRKFVVLHQTIIKQCQHYRT